ncbi:hypothetical protein D3C71_1802850 [compost metagenome]
MTVVRLVGGAGEHRHGRYLFPGRQADESLLVPGRTGLLDHHLLGRELLTCHRGLPRHRLDHHGQMDLRIDPQGAEKCLSQIVPGHGR